MEKFFVSNIFVIERCDPSGNCRKLKFEGKLRGRLDDGHVFLLSSNAREAQSVRREHALCMSASPTIIRIPVKRRETTTEVFPALSSSLSTAYLLSTATSLFQLMRKGLSSSFFFSQTKKSGLGYFCRFTVAFVAFIPSHPFPFIKSRVSDQLCQFVSYPSLQRETSLIFFFFSGRTRSALSGVEAMTRLVGHSGYSRQPKSTVSVRERENWRGNTGEKREFIACAMKQTSPRDTRSLRIRTITSLTFGWWK